MKIITYTDFLERIERGWPNKLDLSAYIGMQYECVCGEKHYVHPGIKVSKELPLMKMVILCPDGEGQTCVRIKGWFRPRFVSLFGALYAD